MKLANLLRCSQARTKGSLPRKILLSYFKYIITPPHKVHPNQSNKKQFAFSYVEVLVAMFILAVAIGPAMEAIQSGIQGAGIHELLAQQHFALIKRMEETQAEAYANLLYAAQSSGNHTAPSSYSDPDGQADRILVFLALYDPNSLIDPFSILDPDNDADNDLYTGDTSNLLWLRVTIENSAQSMETLISR